jgi:hypothetical protein
VRSFERIQLRHPHKPFKPPFATSEHPPFPNDLTVLVPAREQIACSVDRFFKHVR